MKISIHVPKQIVSNKAQLLFLDLAYLYLGLMLCRERTIRVRYRPADRVWEWFCRENLQYVVTWQTKAGMPCVRVCWVQLQTIAPRPIWTHQNLHNMVCGYFIVIGIILVNQSECTLCIHKIASSNRPWGVFNLGLPFRAPMMVASFQDTQKKRTSPDDVNDPT